MTESHALFLQYDLGRMGEKKWRLLLNNHQDQMKTESLKFECRRLIRLNSPLSEPASDAHPGLLCWHHFMPKIASHETDHGSHSGLNQNESACFVPRCGPELQLATITRLPVCSPEGLPPTDGVHARGVSPAGMTSTQ
jgi:hypothetical protein